jgi:hypothetical protein
MLINKSDLLALKELSAANDLVSLESIPKAFKDDLDRFFFGKTLVKLNGQLFAYPHDIKKWVDFVFYTYKD